MHSVIKIMGAAGLIAFWGCEKPFGIDGESASGAAARHGKTSETPDAPGKGQGKGTPEISSPCAPKGVTTLYGGQHIEVGFVDVVENEGELTITMQTEGGWTLHEVHVAVSLTPEGLASAPGRMPYKAENLGGIGEYQITVNLVELGYDYESPLYIATHAVVMHPTEGEETAWGFGTRYGVGWAWYFSFPKSPCSGVEIDPNTEGQIEIPPDPDSIEPD